MARNIDKQKRAWGGAIKRTAPSRAATVLHPRVRGRVLDFGCGHGFDADHFGWESYDPYYRPKWLEGSFDTIVCVGVVNALSRNNRHRAIERIRGLLAEGGVAYLAVPRNLPREGKLGMHHSLQNYVVLTLPSVHADESLEIYELRKGSRFEDRTREFLTPRDRRVLRS
jgi:SAM-dependent methyltransferase